MPAVIPAFRDHVGGGPDSAMATVAAFHGYKEQFDNRSCDSARLSLLENLRYHHKGVHVSCVKVEDFDLAGYARSKGSRASLRHDTRIAAEACHDLYETSLKYVAPARRLDHDRGHVDVEEHFVPYKLVWDNVAVPAYRTKWPAPNKWDDVEYWFLCVPAAASAVADDNQYSVASDIMLTVGEWTAELHEEIYVFDNSRWRKSKSLYQGVKGSSWDDVIMDAKLKANLIADVQGFFQSQELYRKFKVPWKRGIIMHGVPGNGKTCSIKALVNYLAALDKPIPALYVKTMDNKSNMPQWEVSSIFKKARSVAPCLLILEDLDSLVKEKVRSYFLNEVDGLEANDGILMLGSTNHLDRLDPAIAKRPSRFDRKYHFRVPDRRQRIAYGEYWRGKLQGVGDVDFPSDICPLIADLTDTFSFAYMKELFVVSLLAVARDGTGQAGDEGAGASSDWEEVSEPVPTPPQGTEDGNDNDGEDDDDDDDDDDEEDNDNDCKKCKEAAAKARKNKTKAKAKQKKKEAKAKAAKEKKAREIPVVEVPEELKGNVLFKVMQQQIKMLIHEMDNTDEEDKPRGLMGNDASGSDDEACADC